MQLSKKQKTFSPFFGAFLKSRLNFERFQKKKTMTLLAYVLPILQIAKDVAREVCKKSCFRTPFDKLHGKRSQALLKSEVQRFYDGYSSR